MNKQYIEFAVTHQKIVRKDDFYVVGGSQNYLYARFTFCDDWPKENVYAIFTSVGKSYRQKIVDGECLVPWEVLCVKRFHVGCEAGDRITSDAATVDVSPCGAPDANPGREPTPTFQTQIDDLKVKVEALEKRPTGGEVNPEEVAEAVNSYLRDNPPEGGKDGYTPVKGVDYFDGADGKPGADGKDGYTPVKGVDYFTPEEVQEIAEQAAEMVEVPEGGGSSKWELLAEGSFGATNANKLVINLSSYPEKEEFFLKTEFRKTTEEITPRIETSYVGSALAASYKSSIYAQTGTVYIRKINGVVYGRMSIMHGWGNTQGSGADIAPSPRGGNGMTIYASANPYTDIADFGTFKFYGR